MQTDSCSFVHVSLLLSMASSSTTFSSINSNLKPNPLFHTPPLHFTKSTSPKFPSKPPIKTLQFKSLFANTLNFEIHLQNGVQIPLHTSFNALYSSQKPSIMAIGEKGVKQNQIPLQKSLINAILRALKALQKPAIEENQTPVQKCLKDSILKAFKALQKLAMVAVIMGLLVHDPHEALAASGGRIGGNSFSSRASQSSSRGASARSDSKILMHDSRSTRDKFESSQNYRSSTGFDSFTTGVGFAPSPFGLGGGGVYAAPGVGFGSSFFFIVTSFIGFVLVSGVLSDLAGSEGGVNATGKTTVVKLQVGLLGMARSLQRDLNRIAEAADTSSPEGLHFVLTETILALLRHPDYCISAYSYVDVKRSIDEGERRFNQLSVEERGKFDEETLINVNSIRKQTGTSRRATGFSNEYIVITILVAAEGVHKFPTINSSRDLKDALQKLASFSSSRTMAVEVLWTPQSENDTLSERGLLGDYPLLRPL